MEVMELEIAVPVMGHVMDVVVADANDKYAVAVLVM